MGREPLATVPFGGLVGLRNDDPVLRGFLAPLYLDGLRLPASNAGFQQLRAVGRMPVRAIRRMESIATTHSAERPQGASALS
ncbi:MAG: hypothetical protein ACREYE_11975 [Gammaproteobacteria bacterium]